MDKPPHRNGGGDYNHLGAARPHSPAAATITSPAASGRALAVEVAMEAV